VFAGYGKAWHVGLVSVERSVKDQWLLSSLLHWRRSNQRGLIASPLYSSLVEPMYPTCVIVDYLNMVMVKGVLLCKGRVWYSVFVFFFFTVQKSGNKVACPLFRRIIGAQEHFCRTVAYASRQRKRLLTSMWFQLQWGPLVYIKYLQSMQWQEL
jgi:hypothetical protein